MKIIDLLNKIANGEEVPKKIKYYDIEYKYDGKFYYTDCGFSMYRSMYTEGNCLTDEVEIIEEDKKIEYVPTYVLCDSDFEEKGTYSKKSTEIIDKAFAKYSKAINELIEEIEKLKGKSE